MEYKEKILQFGEGNFLRAFIEEYINEANADGYYGKVVVCQPRTNNRVINLLNAQECSYDIIKRGKLGGEIIDERANINCISRCIDSAVDMSEVEKVFCSDDLEIVISNTTEAGIVYDENDCVSAFPSVSFPAKITYLLNERYKKGKRGLVFFPTELIENNGSALKNCILKYAALWNLDSAFFDYVNNECSFCTTLVDRIVTGHTDKDSDKCSVTCEPYRLLVINCDEKEKSVLPFKDDTVIYTDNLSLYRERKVKILNGIHTFIAPGAYISGIDTVRDAVNDEHFSKMIKCALEEIISTIDLSDDECYKFANEVLERFSNPFIDHKLFDISLNSVAKFKERILPSVLKYAELNGTAPVMLSQSLAYLIAFYNHKSIRDFRPNDSEAVLKFFESKPSVKEVMSNTDFWGVDLNKIPKMTEIVEEFYNEI